MGNAAKVFSQNSSYFSKTGKAICLAISTLVYTSTSVSAETDYIVKFITKAGSVESLSATRPNRELHDIEIETKKESEKISLIHAKRRKIATSSASDISHEVESVNPCPALIANNLVEYCEENRMVYLDAYPNDPQYSSLWALEQRNDVDIDASEAWDLHRGSKNTIVAVIDTGIDYTHPDLVGNIWVNPREIPGNGLDDDKNGYIDDIHGINSALGTGDPLDDHGHGTHVAGIIGAKGNNAIGIVGVNWDVSIIGVKFLGSGGGGTLYDAIRGIDYVTDLKKYRGIDVILSNNSWGGTFYSVAIQDAILRANEAGVLFVAAAGNAGSNNDLYPHYPATYAVPNVISVGALDTEGNLATFSNYGGATVHIAAPGQSILSTLPGNRYMSLSGTSMAAPFVSAALALMKSFNPTLSHLALKDRLLATGDSRTTLAGVTFTGRSLNLKRLLLGETTPSAPTNPAPPKADTDFNLASSHTQLRSGNSYTVTIFGDNARVGKLRFEVKKWQCDFGDFNIENGAANVQFRVPRTPLRGRLKLKAAGLAGKVEDTMQLTVLPSRKAQRYARKNATIHTTPSISKRYFRTWCRRVSNRTQQLK